MTLARLDELTHEWESLERDSRHASVGQFLLSIASSGVLLSPLLGSIGKATAIPPDPSSFPERVVNVLLRPMLAAVPWTLLVILAFAFFGDLLIAAFVRGYESTLRDLEKAHPQAALEAYGRIFSGKLWAGTNLVRNRLALRAARHATMHPELLRELSDEELSGLAGQWAYRAGAAVSEPDDQPLPALELASQDLKARGRTKAFLVIKQRTYMREVRVPQLLPSFEFSPEERLTQVRPPVRVDVLFQVLFWGLLVGTVYCLFGGHYSLGYIGFGAWIILLIAYLAAAKRVTGTYPPFEYLFQVWRLRKNNPTRFLQLTILQSDPQVKLQSKGATEGWAIKAIAQNPGLAEVLRDEDMLKLRNVVKAAKPSRSLPAEILEIAKPLVGAK